MNEVVKEKNVDPPTVRSTTEERRKLSTTLMNSLDSFIDNNKFPPVDTLTSQELENYCLSVLGYLEEYVQPSQNPDPEIAIDDATSLEDLEAQLDISISFFSDLKKQVVTTMTGNLTKISSHRLRTKQKISTLLAYPQVREKLKREYSEEVALYRSAKSELRKVRDIQRLTKKIKQVIYQHYLSSKEKYGKLVESSTQQIAVLEKKLNALETSLKSIITGASESTAGYLETQKLLDYKSQLKENGYVMTPTRLEIIDRVKSAVLTGKKVFLIGSTGTGKSELAFSVLNELTGGYEVIAWHETATPRDVHGYPAIMIDPVTGNSYSDVRPGPYPSAVASKVGLVHEEFTGAPTRVLLELKPSLFKDHSIFQIFTGNPKDTNTSQREEMDPAILRELTGIEVNYMSAQEMFDIIRAMLIEANGILRLNDHNLNYIKRLCEAAEIMQKVHNRNYEGFSDEIKSLLKIDSNGNTETTLKKNFLDPGTLFKLFGEWDLAKAKGTQFDDYMSAKVSEFVNDPKTLGIPEEKETLRSILLTFNLLSESRQEEFSPTLNYRKGYILPSQMNNYAITKVHDPMADLPTEAEENQTATPTKSNPKETDRKELAERLEAQQVKIWSELLGAEVEVPSLPSYITKMTIEHLEALGMELLALPKMNFGTLEELMTDELYSFLYRIEDRYPNLRKNGRVNVFGANGKNSGPVMAAKKYWSGIKDDHGAFPHDAINGKWIAVENMLQPKLFKPHIGSVKMEKILNCQRQNKSWDFVEKLLKKVNIDIRNSAELPDTAVVKMLEVWEWNLLANLKGWGNTEQREWTNTETIYNWHAAVGHEEFGPADFTDYSLSHRGNGIGFRVAIKL